MRTNLLWMAAGIAIGIVTSQTLMLPAPVTVQAPAEPSTAPTHDPNPVTFDAPKEAAYAVAIPKKASPPLTVDPSKGPKDIQETVKKLVAQGKVDAALAQLQAAAKDNPNDAGLNMQIADFYLDVIQDGGKALPFLERALANSEKTGMGMDPALQTLVDLAAGSPDASVRERASKAVRENAMRDDSAEAHVALGRVQTANGDIQGGQKSLEIAAGKGSSEAHHELATAAMHRADWAAAESNMSQALQKEQAKQAQAQANGESGEQFQRAIDTYQMDLGTTQIANGHAKDGVANLREYLKRHPDDIGAQDALADGMSRAEGEVGPPRPRAAKQQRQ